MFRSLVVVAAAVYSTGVVAQDSAPAAPAPVTMTVPASASTTGRNLPANTLMQVTPSQEISSKRIEEGQKVGFTVVSDVVEQGTVVIPRGSLVEGTITWKTGRAVGGKSGKFEVRFDNVMLNGKRYTMTGVHRQEGRGNTTGALLGSILISGRSAVMLPGQIVNAFTSAPIPY